MKDDQASGANFSMVILVGDVAYAGVSGSSDGEELSESEFYLFLVSLIQFV
jgi:hypothetical protein